MEGTRFYCEANLLTNRTNRYALIGWVGVVPFGMETVGLEHHRRSQGWIPWTSVVSIVRAAAMLLPESPFRCALARPDFGCHVSSAE
jgi:hypothetical protein